MTRAEEAALKAYPVYGKWIGNQYGDWDNDINSTLRKAYLQGYEQAEKDTNPQEQPVVDLERDAVQFCFDKGLNITPYQAKTIASHFYELGFNARKEEYP